MQHPFTPPETPGTSVSQPKSFGPELERLSTIMPNILNTRDFDLETQEAQELQHYLAPDLKFLMDTQDQKGEPWSWKRQLAAWKERAEELPNVQFALMDISSDVDESNGEAKVFMEMEVSGIGEVKLHAMNEVLWRRSNGRWQCYYVLGMRGTPGNSGFG